MLDLCLFRAQSSGAFSLIKGNFFSPLNHNSFHCQGNRTSLVDALINVIHFKEGITSATKAVTIIIPSWNLKYQVRVDPAPNLKKTIQKTFTVLWILLLYSSPKCKLKKREATDGLRMQCVFLNQKMSFIFNNTDTQACDNWNKSSLLGGMCA